VAWRLGRLEAALPECHDQPVMHPMALTQQSRHQGQTGAPTFRRMGQRRRAGGQSEGRGSRVDLESGVIS